MIGEWLNEESAYSLTYIHWTIFIILSFSLSYYSYCGYNYSFGRWSCIFIYSLPMNGEHNAFQSSIFHYCKKNPSLWFQCVSWLSIYLKAKILPCKRHFWESCRFIVKRIIQTYIWILGFSLMVCVVIGKSLNVSYFIYEMGIIMLFCFIVITKSQRTNIC